MKPANVAFETYKVGPFTIYVGPATFEERPADVLSYFNVRVTQDVQDNAGQTWTNYINLIEDERFAIFSHMTTFSRPITEEDMVEFNYYTDLVFSQGKPQQPCWKLSRNRIVWILDTCEALAKKLKKKK